MLLLAGAFLFPTCRHKEVIVEPEYCMEKGTIIGLDYRLCPCCGGWSKPSRPTG